MSLRAALAGAVSLVGLSAGLVGTAQATTTSFSTTDAIAPVTGLAACQQKELRHG